MTAKNEVFKTFVFGCPMHIVHIARIMGDFSLRHFGSKGSNKASNEASEASNKVGKKAVLMDGPGVTGYAHSVTPSARHARPPHHLTAS